MAYSARIFPAAEIELDLIVAYLVTLDSSVATNFLNEYMKQLDLLCEGVVEYPLSKLPELANLGYHVALVNNYLFFYYIEDNCLVVAHIFHQRQNYAPLVLFPVLPEE